MADQLGDLFRRGRVRKAVPDQTAGFREFALAVPPAEALNFVAADFGVEITHGSEVRKSGYFILSGEVDPRGSHRIEKTKLLRVGETFGEVEASFPVNTRTRGGLVERYDGGPLRNGIVAFAALVEADMCPVDLVEQVGGALHKQIRESRGRSGVDEGEPIFLLEALGVAQLLGFEGIAGKVGAQVKVVRPQAQGGAQHDFVEHRSRSIDDQL